MLRLKYSTGLATAFVLAAVVGCNGSNDKDEIAAKVEGSTTPSPSAHSTQLKDVKEGNTALGEKRSTNLSNEVSLTDLRKILAPRETEVAILSPRVPEDIARIQMAMMEATKKSPEWFMAYVKSEAETGKPLPYHPNFGITKDEYQHYLDGADKIKLEPVGKGRIKFFDMPEDRVRIEAIDGLKELDQVVIDCKRREVVTRWGTIPLNDTVHADERSPVGRWDGLAGRVSTGTVESGTASLLRFDLGRLRDSPSNFLCLSVRVAENGVKTTSIETAIRFP